MVGHGESSGGSYLADPTSPIPSHCVSIVVTSTVRVNTVLYVLTCDRQLRALNISKRTKQVKVIVVSRGVIFSSSI